MFRRLKNQLWRLVFAAISAVCLAGVAHAAPMSDSDLLASAFGGETEGFAKMNDTELGDARGGYRGFAFGLFISGDISNIPSDGSVPDGVDILEQTPDNVSLSVGLAGLASSGGLIQFASIVGDNNVINNNMTLNVFILEGGTADLANIADGSFLLTGS